MNDLAASIGLVQLGKLPEMNRKRGAVIAHYMHVIESIDGIEAILPYDPEQYVYQMFGVRTDSKEALILYLKSKGIATGCHYTPLSVQPLFSEWGHNCPYIEREIERCVTLPLHPDLTPEELDYLAESLQGFSATCAS